MGATGSLQRAGGFEALPFKGRVRVGMGLIVSRNAANTFPTYVARLDLPGLTKQSGPALLLRAFIGTRADGSQACLFTP